MDKNEYDDDLDLPFSPADDLIVKNEEHNKEENTLNNNLEDNEMVDINIFSSDDEEKTNDINNAEVEVLPDSIVSIQVNEGINQKQKNNKTFTLEKLNRILPIVAFIFVFSIGIYVFINNAKASVVNLIKIEENSKTGYIDSEGELIVKPKYLYGDDFYKGYAVVKNYNNLYGIIDSKGKNKIAFGNVFSATLFGNRYVVSKFTSEGLKMGLMTSSIEELTRFKYDNITYSAGGIFIFTRDDTMGIMNNDGKEIYTYKVDEVDEHDISIEISNVDNGKNKYAKIKVNSSSTIINIETGKEVFRYTLSDINVLDNNVFYIKQENGNNNYFVINNDKVIYETTNYKRLRIEDLDSNIALGIKENTKIDYINLTNGEIINTDDDIEYSYSDGVIVYKKYDFELKKEIYTIYTPNKTLGTISDIKLNDTKYKNDYMKVKTENDKYIFINKKGKIITKKEYDYASDFDKNGYAIVSNDNSIGVINSKGEEIIPLKYDETILMDDVLFNTIKNNTKKELFIVKQNEKYGILDSKGNVVIKPIYDGFDVITTKYPIIEGIYNNEIIIINLETFKDINVKVNGDVEVYDNYMIINGNYYNYDGKLIYTIGG